MVKMKPANIPKCYCTHRVVKNRNDFVNNHILTMTSVFTGHAYWLHKHIISYYYYVQGLKDTLVTKK